MLHKWFNTNVEAQARNLVVPIADGGCEAVVGEAHVGLHVDHLVPVNVRLPEHLSMSVLNKKLTSTRWNPEKKFHSEKMVLGSTEEGN